MFNNGIDFNWVTDENDKKHLQELWDAALKEDTEEGQKKNLAAFKKAYQKIREKQIESRKAPFESAHQKIEKTLGAFGNLIKLD